MVRVDDWLKTPVRDGNIRLHGQWSGSIYASGHVMDMLLPLQYDIPIAHAEKLVKEFMAQDAADKAKDAADKAKDAADKAMDGEADNAGPDAEQGVSEKKWTRQTSEEKREFLQGKTEEKRNLLQVWRDISVYLKTSSYSMSPQSSSPALNRSGMPGVEHPGSSVLEERYDKVKHEDEVMRVDMIALNALVEELRENNDALVEENKKLQEEYHQGSLGRWLAHLRHRDASDEGSSSSDGEEQEDKAENDAEKPPKLNAGEVWLRGQFVGTVMTHKHFLDIALPFQGAFEGHRAVEVLKAVANKESGQSARGRKEKTTWEQFAQLVEGEYAHFADQAKPADNGNMETQVNGANAAEMDALEGKLRSASDQLNNTREELRVTQSENARLHREATSWREHATASAAAHTEAASLAIAAGSAALRPRSPLAAGALHQVLRSRSPLMGRPRATLTPRGGLLGTGGTSPWHTEDRGGVQSPGPGATDTGLCATVDPARAFQMQADAEQVEHQALVHDLKQLEQWARELRTMSGR